MLSQTFYSPHSASYFEVKITLKQSQENNLKSSQTLQVDGVISSGIMAQCVVTTLLYLKLLKAKCDCTIANAIISARFNTGAWGPFTLIFNGLKMGKVFKSNT